MGALVESSVVDVTRDATALGVDDDRVDCAGHVAEVVVESVAANAHAHAVVVSDLVLSAGVGNYHAATVGDGFSLGAHEASAAEDLTLVVGAGLRTNAIGGATRSNAGKSVLSSRGAPSVACKMRRSAGDGVHTDELVGQSTAQVRVELTIDQRRISAESNVGNDQRFNGDAGEQSHIDSDQSRCRVDADGVELDVDRSSVGSHSAELDHNAELAGLGCPSGNGVGEGDLSLVGILLEEVDSRRKRSQHEIRPGRRQVANSDTIPGTILVDEQIYHSRVEVGVTAAPYGKVHAVSCNHRKRRSR